ncbi:MAG: hypothetical protein NC344_02350 [Bacteroidales bacterium]|nr:hypothetical protein [Bacteroidales bacterium]MCM1146673.1 hypothetical protein [Bacteroidales bacterium]MCM1206063.1 hypothetical protein [Bacillota bacterium]MCM1511034.1 hypothetical protein [Clostridium sp.]
MKKLFYLLGVSVVFCSCNTTVYDSDISETDKDALIKGVTVGYASSKLWKCGE